MTSTLSHPLLATLPAEATHQINKSGREACEKDLSLAPGHDCCAICAKKGSDLTACSKCQKVSYCGEKHAQRDQANHESVCALLCALKEAGQVDISTDAEAQLLAKFKATAKDVGAACGWADVLPDELLNVSGKPEAKARSSKRARHNQADSSHGTPAPDTDTEANTPKANGEAAGTTFNACSSKAPAPPDPQLARAVQVAVLTSFLSYPCTLAHGLASLPALQAVVQGATERGAPLVVTVLGASDAAEVAHLSMWKVLEGVCPAGVVLQLVGPEVPASKHMQVEALPDTHIQAAFFKGEYNALVDYVLVASKPLTRLPPITAPAPPADGEAAAAAEPHTDSSGLPDPLRALPDLLLGYNMGLTCPDYDWTPTMKAMRKVFLAKCDRLRAAQPGKQLTASLPWLHTSNTQAEAEMEEEVVRNAGWSAAAPLVRNPFTSLEPLQSGTLANDVYRKNAWWAAYELCARAGSGAGAGGRSRGRSLTQRLGTWAQSVVKGLKGKVLGGGKRRRSSGQ